METRLQLIVGLGNPGPNYEKTRHNAGAWFIEHLASSYKQSLCLESRFKGKIVHLDIVKHSCYLLSPTTYMNASGESVATVAKFYKIPPQNILVIHDDLDFPPGTIRLKKDGGHGGHNGLKNIVLHLHSKEFYRIRIGIGHPGYKNAVISYVLNKPSGTEKMQIIQAIDRGISAIPELLAGNIDKVTQILHG